MIEEGSKFLHRTCADCINYVWNKDGMVEGINRSAFRTVDACLRSTKPMKRPNLVKPPCHECPKISIDEPRKSYYYADEIDDKIYQAIVFHDECEAVGQWPMNELGDVDSIVRRNAGVIRKIRRECEKAQDTKRLVELLTFRLTT